MKYSLANVPATICSLMHLDIMEGAEKEPIAEVTDMFGGEAAERCLFFSPDAVGAKIVDMYKEDTDALNDIYSHKIELSSIMPSVTPVCYATMMSGTRLPNKNAFASRTVWATAPPRSSGRAHTSCCARRTRRAASPCPT